MTRLHYPSLGLSPSFSSYVHLSPPARLTPSFLLVNPHCFVHNVPAVSEIVFEVWLLVCPSRHAFEFTHNIGCFL